VYNPAADENISRAVMQALALNADERPQSASEMREMMFPEEVAVPNDGSARRFLTTRLLFEILMLSALAGILFFVPRSSGPDPIDVPSTDAAQASKPSPTPVEPVAEPSPNPAEEVARLAEEAERDWQSGREKEAWSKLERALTLDAKNPHVRRLIADMRWEAIANMGKSGERLSEILGEADSILRLVRSPRSAQEYLARAWANFVKGSDPAHPDQELLGRAIADADKVLTKYDANSVAALTIRASATYMKAGSQLDEQTTGRVLEDFDRAIKLAPMYAQLYANQAEIHFALGRRANAPSRTEHLGLALQGFKKAAELAPRAGFYKDIGDVYFEMQNFEQASYNYGAAINVDSMYYPAHVGLCAAYNNLKQFDRAEQICRQALNLQPNDGRVKQELERALYARAAGDE
jgi:tetratricopeptide (TPR) repeat protein